MNEKHEAFVQLTFKMPVECGEDIKNDAYTLGYANTEEYFRAILQFMNGLVTEMDEKGGKPAIVFPDGSITIIDIRKVAAT